MKMGWKWTQWTGLFLSLAVYLFSSTSQETYKRTILQRRAKKLGLEPPKQTIPGGLAGLKVLLTVTLFRPIHMLMFEPIVALFGLYTAFCFGVLFAFLPAFPIVFQGVYRFNLGETGLTFISLSVGYILAVPTSMVVDRLIYQSRYREAIKNGKQHVAPEHRLYTGMMGSFGVSIGLFWFGWTARRSIHWIVPLIGVVPFAWGNLCIFVSSACLSLSLSCGHGN
jgi:hypothetical protein